MSRPRTLVGLASLVVAVIALLSAVVLSVPRTVDASPRSSAAPGVGETEAGGTEAARTAILAASAAFSRAYVEGDLKALAEVYTADAVLLPPELPAGEVLRGREAAADYFRPRPRRHNLSHAMRPDALVIHGTEAVALAVDTGVWTNVWRSGDDAEPRRAEGRYLVVWRLGMDGRWRIAYDMWHRPPG